MAHRPAFLTRETGSARGLGGLAMEPLEQRRRVVGGGRGGHSDNIGCPAELRASNQAMMSDGRHLRPCIFSSSAGGNVGFRAMSSSTEANPLYAARSSMVHSRLT